MSAYRIANRRIFDGNRIVSVTPGGEYARDL